MIGKDFPVWANAFLSSSEKRVRSAAVFPADTLCFDIFSPPPGDTDVMSQIERLSSKETKIAPRLVRIAVGSSCWVQLLTAWPSPQWVVATSLCDGLGRCPPPHRILNAAARFSALIRSRGALTVVGVGRPQAVFPPQPASNPVKVRRDLIHHEIRVSS